jgi:hypothetical protein
MDWFPDEPEVAPAQRGVGTSAMRYEDVTQDGRLALHALPHALGDVIWRGLLVGHPLAATQRSGVIPILHRFVLESSGGPVSVRNPLAAAGCFELAHTVDETGATERLLLNMWLRLSAPRGRTHGPPPDGAGEVIPVGRVFAEHVFTRPFAPPGERRITRFELPGLPTVPERRHAWRPFDAVLAAPPGAVPLDEAPVSDGAPFRFGLNHTDSNQHVNSLVYPRLFLEAALRRFAAHGRSTALIARRCEIAYRKPCFAGDEARIELTAFTDGDDLCAVGAFLGEGGSPHCAIAMRFTR